MFVYNYPYITVRSSITNESVLAIKSRPRHSRLREERTIQNVSKELDSSTAAGCSCPAVDKWVWRLSQGSPTSSFTSV